jgi:hypothetical protein
VGGLTPRRSRNALALARLQMRSGATISTGMMKRYFNVSDQHPNRQKIMKEDFHETIDEMIFDGLS